MREYGLQIREFGVPEGEFLYGASNFFSEGWLSPLTNFPY
jgi:hypothetical protein